MATQVRPPRALAERIGETAVARGMVRVESFGQLAGILVDQHRDLRVVRQGAGQLAHVDGGVLVVQLPVAVVGGLHGFGVGDRVARLRVGRAARGRGCGLVGGDGAELGTGFGTRDRRTGHAGQLSGRRGGIVGQQTRVGRLLDIGKGQGGGRSADQSRKGCG